MSSDRMRAFSTHSWGGLERKVSVLDDRSAHSGRSKSDNGREDIKKKIEMNKGVRDLHFELQFDKGLAEKAQMIEGDEA